MSLISWRKLQAGLGNADTKDVGVATRHIQSNVDLPVIVVTAIKASDDLRNSNDTAKGTAEITYTKLKETKFNVGLEVCRIKFNLWTGTAGETAYGQIYKNGVAIGTQRDNATETHTTFSQDFTDFLVDDLVQVYVRATSGYAANVENLRFYYKKCITGFKNDVLVTSLDTTTDPTISMLNQDP